MSIVKVVKATFCPLSHILTLAQFSLNNVHKRGLKHHHFTFGPYLTIYVRTISLLFYLILHIYFLHVGIYNYQNMPVLKKIMDTECVLNIIYSVRNVKWYQAQIEPGSQPQVDPWAMVMMIYEPRRKLTLELRWCWSMSPGADWPLNPVTLRSIMHRYWQMTGVYCW